MIFHDLPPFQFKWFSISILDFQGNPERMRFAISNPIYSSDRQHQWSPRCQVNTAGRGTRQEAPSEKAARRHRANSSKREPTRATNQTSLGAIWDHGTKQHIFQLWFWQTPGSLPKVVVSRYAPQNPRYSKLLLRFPKPPPDPDNSCQVTKWEITLYSSTCRQIVTCWLDVTLSNKLTCTAAVDLFVHFKVWPLKSMPHARWALEPFSWGPCTGTIRTIELLPGFYCCNMLYWPLDLMMFGVRSYHQKTRVSLQKWQHTQNIMAGRGWNYKENDDPTRATQPP